MTEEEFKLRMAELGSGVSVRITKSDGTEEDITPSSDKVEFSRQREDDPYQPFYKDQRRLIKPPYDPEFLTMLHEQSDSLQSNIGAYIQNVVGFGYTLNYLGDDSKNKPQEDLDEQDRVLGFLEEPNENDTWLEILKRTAEDYYKLGPGAIEFIRNTRGELSLAYNHPTQDLRLVPISKDDYVEEVVPLKRNGKVEKVTVLRCYRRYAKVIKKNGKLRYYKSFGDLRYLDKWTGNYSDIPIKVTRNASEILWMAHPLGTNPYGLPPWIGSTFDVAGRRDAQAMNWDLLRSQGVPPMVIMVKGKLTNGSWDEIWNMVLGARGVENFNRVWVLQVQDTPTSIGQRGGADIQIQDMGSMQKTDQMFNNYLPGTEDRIRQNMRNPPAFVGATGAYSYAVLQSSKALGEEQVFGPEKIHWDNRFNRSVFCAPWPRGFGLKKWKYKTKGPEVSSTEDLRSSISAFTSAGALSINNAIELVNDALGRTFSKFDEEWANYPLLLVQSILNRGALKGMENLESAPQQQPGMDLGGGAPGETFPALKVLEGGLQKSDMSGSDLRQLRDSLYDLASKIDEAVLTRKVK